MPEYLAPGVYVEEVSFRSKSIEGVATSVAGFVGPTRFGPISGEPELLTSLDDFQRYYGSFDDLQFSDHALPMTNYMAYAVRAFFEEGGQMLYVSRTYQFSDGIYEEDSNGIPIGGYATFNAGSMVSPPDAEQTWLVARFPGSAGNIQVTFTLQVGTNAFRSSNTSLTRVQPYDLVYVGTPQYSSPPGKALQSWLPHSGDGLFLASFNSASSTWELLGDGGHILQLSDLSSSEQVRPLTVLVEVASPTVNAQGAQIFDVSQSLGAFSFDPRSPNGLTNTFTRKPPTRFLALTAPFSIERTDLNSTDPTEQNTLPLRIARDLLGSSVIDTLNSGSPQVSQQRAAYQLSGGNDGAMPGEGSYTGAEEFHDFVGDTLQEQKYGLLAFVGVDDIAIVAAPGYSQPYVTQGDQDRVFAIHGALLDHCETMRYRIAVLDMPPKMLVSDALDFRNLRSSNYGALYYPWVTILDPISGNRLNLPPSGSIAGIYARNDNEHAVFKAPANEVVRQAIDFELRINKPQQEVLNPEGINCFRFFPGYGFLLWGARTISDDPEWKYVSLRRYFAYLEHSIDKGTQWVVFENNGPQLWDNVRRTVEDFLYNEWKMGGLLGNKPEQAFFVRCDLSTMTQNDLDNGRLICLIGVAPVRPAEFVIFRIGQITSGTTS